MNKFFIWGGGGGGGGEGEDMETSLIIHKTISLGPALGNIEILGKQI